MSNDNIDTKLYPPLPPEELRDAHAFENLDRVVVTQHGVYARRRDGGWFQLRAHATTKMGDQFTRMQAALVRIGILNASGAHPDPEIDQAIRDAVIDVPSVGRCR